MSRPRPTRAPQVTVSVRLPEPLVVLLDAHASTRHVTVSAVLRDLVQAALTPPGRT